MKNRDFLKDTIRRSIDFSQTEQARGNAPPPLEKPAPDQSMRIDLPRDDWHELSGISLVDAIMKRKSRRMPTRGDISITELSFLLWATQGIRRAQGPYQAFRTVPSAGCRHAFETYIAIFRATGLEKAIYRYLPLKHQLIEVARYDESVFQLHILYPEA